ncbi:MAG TPA: sigma 54-interacting transcriptional regulator [Vicinamibacterales bacterium]|nr:sigma 54-interacting transcriptional regulator [Vicinamibacterales bacterium]
MVSVALQPVMARVQAALEQGRAAEATQLLTQALRSAALTREDELAVRCTLAEAWFLQDDIAQASAVLGRPPDTLRETIPPALLSHLWRLHGRVAAARGEQSRAIALHGRALKQAEIARDPRAIGLAHFELARCYKQIDDTGTMREHFAAAASALHAVGDKRNLALVHSLSGSALAQSGRWDEALTAWRLAERLAAAVKADDVLAIICGNQANVAFMRHRYEEALALAERSVALHEQFPPGHGLAVALATLGQICIRLGDLARAEAVLQRGLEVRRPLLFHETTGAIFDSLAQVHLIRGSYDQAEEYLQKAREAYGAYDRHTPRWYDWSLQLLEARLALRRGLLEQAVTRADAMAQAPGIPPADLLHAHLIAAAALLEAGKLQECDQRLDFVSARLDARAMPGAWAEFLRVRAELHVLTAQPSDAYHELAQSISTFELLGERYEAARSHLVLGRLAARAGARSRAERHLNLAEQAFQALGAKRDLEITAEARALLSLPGSGEFIGTAADADDAIVRRLVDAAALPELLSKEIVAALQETCAADAVVLFVKPPSGGDVRVLASVGCESDAAQALARSAAEGTPPSGTRLVEGFGADTDGVRQAIIAGGRPHGHVPDRRLRVIALIARQGFELCAARERPLPADAPAEQSLEPLLPGFLCVSAAMKRVADQIQRLQGNDLTVLITGESGTGKELVARAIHVGSLRRNAMFLPYNCTTTTRELADSQLFGHRRGSFTGAVTDQPGLIRSAAGGTLFLDEIGDLPLDVQPKLLRFLEQGEVMPVGETRPQKVDVRVIAATNADLEQRVSEGKFREDLYYRLSVIRIRVPSLRERREEIPHLTMFFLREASERLGKPDVEISSQVLDLFAQYMWPGNVRQLRNEIQRAVALSAPGGTITPDLLSPELSSLLDPASPAPALPGGLSRRAASLSLAAAVEEVERELIRNTLDRTHGNISEAARTLGLTRRGLYLKLRRLGMERQVGVDTN